MIEKGKVAIGKRFDRDITAIKVGTNINFVVNTMLRSQCRWDSDGDYWLRTIADWCLSRYGIPDEVAICFALYDLEDPMYFVNRQGKRELFSDPCALEFKLQDLEDKALEMLELWLKGSGMSAQHMENLHSDFSMAMTIHEQSLALARAYVRSTGGLP